MRGVVTFQGPVMAGAALLRALGCSVLETAEADGVSYLEVFAEGAAASGVALAVCEEAFSFDVNETVPRRRSGFHPAVLVV